MSNITQEPVTTVPTDTGRPVVTSSAARRVLAVLRLMFGFTFLWAFFDKTFGLGFATPSAKAWINGGSPTKGYLSGSEGPFSGFYHAIAGNGVVNVLFMLGLLAIGVALILGIGLRIAAVAGGLMYLMMWSVVLPLSTNPIIDDHLTGAVTLALFALTGAGATWGLGRWWAGQEVVARNPWLR
ncbi:DoxX family membrane protein [Microlunatus aurantiacus]|uniref:DoxX family membrane protein n=1 Tax=Microlunatus aurantiacus TaxID=446786 RepID=A0ABP7D104_9ACTN